MGKNARILLIILMSVQAFWGYSTGEAQASDPKKESGRKIVATKANLFHAAKKILVLNWYDLKTVDEAAGTVSTDVTSMRVNVSDCNCEEKKWQAEDKRSIINVSVDIKVDDNRIAIQARIIGDYP
ncbi:MAG: hypothetical protein H8E81_09640, partial [Deltaproteobacteria bacterium]|nr:hypothetical protein [Deltaproteobacteria bacterium]